MLEGLNSWNSVPVCSLIRGFPGVSRHIGTGGADQYQRVLALEFKRTRPSIAQYLEPEDMRVILDQPDRRTAQGSRHHALLTFMYNTGARVGEVLAVRLEDLNLGKRAGVAPCGAGIFTGGA